MSCPVCTSNDIVDLLDVGSLPILCNQLWPTEEAARSVPRGDMKLGFCAACGHIFNTRFDASKVEYSPDYENSLHCSGQFRRYADELVSRLVGRYGLRQKRVVEIGCGQGDFLKALCKAGDNTGLGFDPSYAGGNADPRVTIHPISFADVEGALEADFVCCRHVLEHIERPTEFLRVLASKLEPGTAVLFEVPNVLFTLRDGGIWDLIYEHCGYFSPSSLQRSFECAGLDVDDLEDTFEGQFLVAHARPGVGSPAESLSGSDVQDLAAGFADSYRAKIAQWRSKLPDSGSSHERVVAWGAGSKGNTFLNTVGQNVSAIVDINPKKHGKFVAGTGQPIVAPQSLLEDPPSTVVIMNPVYRSEIAEQLRALGLSPRLLVA